MALIKGNRSAEPSQEGGLSLPPLDAAPERKGVIFRSRLDQSAPQAAPLSAPPDGGEGFEEGLAALPKAPSATRILNHRATIAPSTLPPITTSVRVPTGGNEPEPEPGHQESSHQQQQVVYQQATPVDQAIIEEAQQRAQQMMQEAQAAANQMLMEYQQQAQSMMEQANQQIQAAAEQVQRQAQEIGFQQGYEQGLQQGGLVAQQQVYQQLVESRDIFIQAIKQRHLMLASAEPDLARLAVKIAEKLVGQELAQNPEAVVGIVRLALAGIGDREQVLIRVNPVDYDKVVEHRSDFEKMIEGLKKFDVTADAAIDVGGCAVETNLGNIDARLATRVSAMTAGLEEVVVLQEKEISDQVATMDTGVPDLPPPPSEDGEPYQEESPAEAPEEE
ncbi:hypothetical protein IV102_09635 [bacterium]|nr:hypothetical protein [bacterium]